MLRKEFFNYLKNDIFVIPKCLNCNKFIWPPFYLCDNCHQNTTLIKGSRIGNIKEYSTSYYNNKTEIFALVEIDGIRLMGNVVGEKILKGSTVILKECGIKIDGTPYFSFILSEDQRLD